MMTMLFISLALAVLYTGAAILAGNRLPDSVSAMVYVMPKAGRYLWTVWIWAVTLLLCPALFETIGEDFGVLAHCFATSMMFVGAMPLVRNESNKAHNVLGVAAGVFSQLCVLLINHCWLIMWFGFVASVFFVVYRKNKSLNIVLTDYGVFLSESFCWLTLVCCLFSEMV